MRCLITLLSLAAALAGALPAGSAARKPDPVRFKVAILAAEDAAFSLEDIEAAVAASPAEAVALVGPAQDLILMLVLDLSEDLTLAQRATSALLNELEKLPPRVYIALLRAQDGLRVIQDPTLNRAAIRTAVESLTISGRAGLLDSVETAATIADSILAKSDVRVAVLYVTDSDVTNYRQDFTNPVINSSDAGDLSRKFPEALIQEQIAKLDASLARGFAPVFVVHISYRSDRRNEAYLNGIRRLASTAGGTAFICRSNAEIPEAIGTVLETIRNHYSLTLEAPRNTGGSVDVQLTIGGSGGVQNLSYRSRFTLKKE